MYWQKSIPQIMTNGLSKIMSRVWFERYSISSIWQTTMDNIFDEQIDYVAVKEETGISQRNLYLMYEAGALVSASRCHGVTAIVSSTFYLL